MDSWSSGPIDSHTGRLRQPNEQYTVLTEEQMQNVGNHASMHFHTAKPENYPHKRYWKPRYCNLYSQHHIRGMSKSQPYDWLDYQWDQNPSVFHDTNRQGSHIKWGPKKTGEKTVSHFERNRTDGFLNIDMYRRPPTNQVGPVVMDCGRPGEGYPSQKIPTQATWFDTSIELNRTDILTGIRPKTKAEYQYLQQLEQMNMNNDKWQNHTEYTDRYLMKTKSQPRITNLEARKKHLEMSQVSV